MKRWLKIWLIGVGVILLVAVLIGLALGSSVETRHEQAIKAPSAKIHRYVASLHRWRAQIEQGLRQQDPSVKVTLEGPDAGAGSMLRWSGEELGDGWVMITRDDPALGIWYEAAVRDDEPNLRGSITYEVSGGTTNVVVQTEGDLPPVIGGYIAGYIEEQLRAHVAQGLEQLKKDLEK